MVDMVPLASSNLAAAGYDAEARELTIAFKGGAEYVYTGVGEPTFRDLLAAPSPGRYFASFIRDAFSFRRET